MRNTISHNQLDEWRHFEDTVDRLEVENQKMTESFFEKLQNYSKEYAEEKGFKAIFAKTEMGGPIVYMDESADITMDFIKYMNEKEKSAK